MPVFVLNLESAAHRLNNIREQLRTLDITFERVPAVLGNQLSADELLDAAPSKSWLGKRMPSPGEIGCFLSHRCIMEMVIARKLKAACILEDDVQLSTDFRDILLAAENLPAEADALKLEIVGPRPKLKFIPAGTLAGRSLAFIPERGWPGTAAYIITAKGAERLLADMRTMVHMCDYQVFDYLSNGLLTYHLLPLPAVQIGESEIGRPGKSIKKPSSLAQLLMKKGLKRIKDFYDQGRRLRFQIQKFGLMKALMHKRTCRRENLVQT